jgi:opacity protein-like surface antigen
LCPVSRVDDAYFHHDQTQRNDYLVVGVGLDYEFGENWSVGATYARNRVGREHSKIQPRCACLGVFSARYAGAANDP